MCLPRVVSSFGTFGCGERRRGEEKTRRRAKARAKATASTDVKLFKSSTQALKSLNPAHLKALLGQEVGDEVEFTAPGGTRRYEVLKIRYQATSDDINE